MKNFLYSTPLYLIQIRRRHVSGPARSYDRGLSATIFFRGIFALAKSKRSRINRPGYFSCFFPLFWKLRAYVEHIRHFINAVMILASLLSLLFSPPLHSLAAFNFFRKLCGLRHIAFWLLFANFSWFFASIYTHTHVDVLPTYHNLKAFLMPFLIRHLLL